MKWFWILATLVLVAHSIEVHQQTDAAPPKSSPRLVTRFNGPVFRAASYERATQTLNLLFVSGYEYTYNGVPFRHYRGLEQDHGRAGYYQHHIRGHYQAQRVDAD